MPLNAPSPQADAASGPETQPVIRVEVAHSPAPRELSCELLTLPAHATVRDALQASTLWRSLPESPPGQDASGGDWRGLRLAIFGSRVHLDRPLEDGDRLDVCRALRVDPKRARRERFSQQGAGRSGLFAKRRPGSVPGY
ncbi:hypothetical protein CCO03_09705 [Comamonas serinivorans]|uniref:UPF0125 protein CCO03_09705 n=1 Tax=Comamonas serinivorans TaxID=1082851 RepID=A0A1Y0ET43_9BURK|nr:RnfH family protein [Comamonas serinivorans]ARU06763.1 hypothetical protein CCO03_09705 [Comamonas serinivorans]